MDKDSNTMNVVICGGGEGEAWLHAAAWRDTPGAALHGICADTADTAASRAQAWDSHYNPVHPVHPCQAAARAQARDCRAFESFESVLADESVRAALLLHPMANRADAAVAALEAGKQVIMGAPFAENVEQAEKIQAATKSAAGALVSAEPWFHYPPLQKVFRLIEKKSVGRVTSVRMRAVVAGRGGWDEFLTPEFKPTGESDGAPELSGILFREIYEKISIALRVFGPISEIFMYGPDKDTSAGAAVVTWKHESRAVYGCLDVVCAPDMHIRSATFPRDDAMEFTGSAGIIWLTRGSAQLRNEPAVRVFRGENQFAYGKLDDNWRAAYKHTANHILSRINQKSAPDTAHAIKAISCAQSAQKSAESANRICLKKPS